MRHGLGRRFAPDIRDSDYPMRALLRPRRRPVIWRYWYDDALWADQGETSMCVAFAWCHWFADGPITHPGQPCDQAELYHAAQLVDEFPGEGYDGTTVRAGAKVLADRQRIVAYHWATDAATVIETIKQVGPVVVGTNWYTAMFEPVLGHLRVEGIIEGGHAYVLNGCNDLTRRVRVKNSWGRQWGRQGHAYLTYGDLDRLLSEQGEACIAVEAL